MFQLAALAPQHWRLLLAGIPHGHPQSAPILRRLLEAKSAAEQGIAWTLRSSTPPAPDFLGGVPTGDALPGD